MSPNPLLPSLSGNPLLDEDGIQAQMDAVNRLALGPMYAPRDPSTLAGAGAGSI